MVQNGQERSYIKDKKEENTITEEGKVFFDTNILIYFVDERDTRKQEKLHSLFPALRLAAVYLLLYHNSIRNCFNKFLAFRFCTIRSFCFQYNAIFAACKCFGHRKQ